MTLENESADGAENKGTQAATSPSFGGMELNGGADQSGAGEQAKTADQTGDQSGAGEQAKTADQTGDQAKAGEQAKAAAKPYEIDYKGEKVEVPENYRNEDGTPNVGALLKSLDDARRKIGTGEFNDSVPDEGESYAFSVPEDLGDTIAFNPDAPEMAKLQEGLRGLDVGKALGEKLFGLYAKIRAEEITGEAETAKVALESFEKDQINSVAAVASPEDLKVFGTAAASMWQADNTNAAFDKDPEKSKVKGEIIMRGLKEIDGSAAAVVAMRYLMDKTSGGKAFQGVKAAVGSATDPAARLKELQASDAYWQNDPATLKQVQELMNQMGS